MNDRSSSPDRIAGPGASGQFDAYAGERIADRYDLLRVAFDGANTTIFDAIDTHTGRSVHVKLVAPERSASPSFRSDFDDTMRAVASFSHPNVAALYDWGVTPIGDASIAYAVVEPLLGGSLRDLFDRGRRLSPSQALAVGLDACKALDYAHRRGFVHTELSPSKLVFGDDRRLRVIDFGLARLLGEAQWAQPDSVASHVAWYSAPEQGAGEAVDGRTDVYALCLTLHEAVTGELPFKSESTVAALAARIGRLMPVSADLGPLAAVIERAGRPERDERSTAAEFGQGLMRAASKLPRPEPLPLLSTGLFDTPVEHLRDPDDPTGGVGRPRTAAADGTTEIIVVPIDEPAGGSVAPDLGAATAGVEPDEPLDGSLSPADAATAGAVAAAAAVGAGAVVESTGIASDDAAPAAPSPTDPAPIASTDPPESAATSAEITQPADDHPDAPVIVEAEPDLDLDAATSGGDDLVILPLDSDIDRAPLADPTVAPDATVTDGDLLVTEDLAVATTATMPATPVPAAEPARRSRWHWIWKVIAGLVLLGAAIVGTIAAMEFFATPTYEVPDLVEVPIEDARAQIAENGWILSVDNERSDLVPEPGRVVRTAPAAGIDLAEGEPFLLVVSDGPTLREVPESTGELLSAAQTRLLERGLAVELDERFDEDVAEGRVISWVVVSAPDVTAGTMVEPGTEVLLSVSLGPEPRTVPELTGVSFADAVAQLGALRLTLSQSGDEFSDEISAGSIISQAPEPGATVERNTDIAVVVSLGPDVVPFPDISGADDFVAAADILREAAYDPRLVLGDAQGEVQSVRIEGQEPAVGQLFRRGTVVEIIAVDDA